MHHTAWNSPAQLLGYATFVLSMITFSIKSDSKFKNWLTLQNCMYALHFFLLGNLPAVAGAMLSAVRNQVSLRTRSLWAMGLMLAANLAVGLALVRSWSGVLPMAATMVATISMFRGAGLSLRTGMLCATLLWLANNILSGSIGGTAMESVIAVISCVTIYRLLLDARRAAAAQA